MALIGYVRECKCKPDFKHKNGAGKEVACVNLDHYIKGCNGNPKDPLPSWLAWTFYKDATRERYGQSEPVVSGSMLASCPLQVYFETHVPYVEKIKDGRFKLRGTLAHMGILQHLEGNRDWLIEQQYVLTMPSGVEVRGTIDGHELPRKCIHDLKTQEPFAIDKKLKMSDQELEADVFVRANIAQVNAYASILREHGYQIDLALLHYFDTKLRVRTLPVRLVEHDKMLAWMDERAQLLTKVLSGELGLREIQEEKVGTAWDFIKKKSPVWWRIEAFRNGRLDEALVA